MLENYVLHDYKFSLSLVGERAENWIRRDRHRAALHTFEEVELEPCCFLVWWTYDTHWNNRDDFNSLVSVQGNKLSLFIAALRSFLQPPSSSSFSIHSPLTECKFKRLEETESEVLSIQKCNLVVVGLSWLSFFPLTKLKFYVTMERVTRSSRQWYDEERGWRRRQSRRESAEFEHTLEL